VVVKKKETEEKTVKKTVKSHSQEPKIKKKKTEEKLTPQSHSIEEEKKVVSHTHKETTTRETSAHEIKSVEHKTHFEHKTHSEIKTESHLEKMHVPQQVHNVCPPEQTRPAKKIKEASQPEINIGMIGHVDHGKTSLTKALTGKWCDTHSEEVKRGISIRLGYADVTFYKLKTQNGIIYSNKPEYNGKPAEIESKRVVSFVDAPGHETLMTTMLSGAALMNGAVLVIASNEACPQPRTVEHLMALKFAGVEKIVVAQNKIDLITKEQAVENHKAIRKFLDEYGYKDAPIVPTAANFGVNIDSLIEAIETHIPTPNYDTQAPLKMFVARSFDINKPGTKAKDLKGAIIGGSITQGIIKVGDEIEILPGLNGPTKTKVLSISTDQGLVQQARPGGLIAVGTDLDPSMAQNDRLRGQIAGKVGSLPRAVKDMVIKVFMFERMLEQNLKEKTQIKVTDPLVITIGTNTIVGFVIKIDPKSCTLNLKNEVVIEKGEKVALSKNIAGQWRLVAYGEVM